MSKKRLTLAKRADTREAKIAKRIKVWQRKFLAALAKTPSVKHACKASGISRDTAYRHRKENREFADAWLAAIGASVDELETKAFALALAGDSNLIQFMLRCHRPEIYRETSRHELGLLGGIVLLPQKKDEPE